MTVSDIPRRDQTMLRDTTIWTVTAKLREFGMTRPGFPKLSDSARDELSSYIVGATDPIDTVKMIDAAVKEAEAHREYWQSSRLMRRLRRRKVLGR
jgi:hypothetical protein